MFHRGYLAPLILNEFERANSSHDIERSVARLSVAQMSPGNDRDQGDQENGKGQRLTRYCNGGHGGLSWCSVVRIVKQQQRENKRTRGQDNEKKTNRGKLNYLFKESVVACLSKRLRFGYSKVQGGIEEIEWSRRARTRARSHGDTSVAHDRVAESRNQPIEIKVLVHIGD